MAIIYGDIYGSIPRRFEQDAKDAAELARPVRSIFSGAAAGSVLNLRALGSKAELPMIWVEIPRAEREPGDRPTRYNARLARRKAKAAS